MAVGPGEEIGSRSEEEEEERGDEFNFSIDNPLDTEPADPSASGFNLDLSFDLSEPSRPSGDFDLGFDEIDLGLAEELTDLTEEDSPFLDTALDIAITGLTFVNPLLGVTARVARAGFTGGAPAAKQAAISAGVSFGVGTLLGPATGKLRGLAGQLGGKALGTVGAIGGSVLAGSVLSQATQGVRQDITQSLVEATEVSAPTTTSIARRGEPSLLRDAREERRPSEDNPFIARRRAFT